MRTYPIEHPHRGARRLFVGVSNTEKFPYGVPTMFVELRGNVIWAIDKTGQWWIRNCRYRTQVALEAAFKMYSQSRHMRPGRSNWLRITAT
jgi:hypothetical protein